MAKKAEKSSVSVYTKKQAEKIQGKFDKKLSKVLRDTVAIADSFAKKHNEDFELTGSYYVLNEKKTEEYKKKKSK